MRFEDKIIKLKNGSTCVLTPTTAEHSEAMIEYLKVTAAETPFLIRYPDEVNYTVEEEAKLLNDLYEDESTAMILALVDGKVAGNSCVSGMGAKRRLRHRCSFAIALEKEYWGLGIGKAMMDYMTELAGRIGYEQAELGVMSGNDRAKGLYEKCGFVEYGRIPNACKYDDGTYRDEICMVKKL